MIRSGVAGDIAEEVITQRELLGVGPVRCDVGLQVLLAYGFGSAREPSSVVVGKRAGRRVGSVRESRVSLGAGKGPEVAVEGMVLFENDDDMLKRTFGDGDTRARPGRPNRFRTRLRLRALNSLALR